MSNYIAGKNDAFRPPSIDDLTTFAENSQRIAADDLGEILKILGIVIAIIILILIY